LIEKILTTTLKIVYLMKVRLTHFEKDRAILFSLCLSASVLFDILLKSSIIGAPLFALAVFNYLGLIRTRDIESDEYGRKIRDRYIR